MTISLRKHPLILCALLLFVFSGCSAIKEMRYTTLAIRSNREAIEENTYSVIYNKQVVDSSTDAIEKNRDMIAGSSESIRSNTELMGSLTGLLGKINPTTMSGISVLLGLFLLMLFVSAIITSITLWKVSKQTGK